MMILQFMIDKAVSVEESSAQRDDVMHEKLTGTVSQIQMIKKIQVNCDPVNVCF